MQTRAADTWLLDCKADDALEFQREGPAWGYPAVFTIPAGCLFGFRQGFEIK